MDKIDITDGNQKEMWCGGECADRWVELLSFTSCENLEVVADGESSFCCRQWPVWKSGVWSQRTETGLIWETSKVEGILKEGGNFRSADGLI